MANRVNLQIEDRIPATQMVVMGRGAVLNGNQNLVQTFTVHSGHDFEVGHKFLYALTRTNILTNRVFTVTAKTATTIQFDGTTTSGVDKAWLIPLGTESGGVVQSDGTYSKVEFDGSTVPVYQDADGEDAYTLSKVPVDPGGECGWWQNAAISWAISLSTSGKPLRAYAGVGSSGGMATGTALPALGDPGSPWFLLRRAGFGDILYFWGKNSADVYDWVEVFSV